MHSIQLPCVQWCVLMKMKTIDAESFLEIPTIASKASKLCTGCLTFTTHGFCESLCAMRAIKKDYLLHHTGMLGRRSLYMLQVRMSFTCVLNGCG